MLIKSCVKIHIVYEKNQLCNNMKSTKVLKNNVQIHPSSVGSYFHFSLETTKNQYSCIGIKFVYVKFSE